MGRAHPRSDRSAAAARIVSLICVLPYVLTGFGVRPDRPVLCKLERCSDSELTGTPGRNMRRVIRKSLRLGFAYGWSSVWKWRMADGVFGFGFNECVSDVSPIMLWRTH